ncbi:unnamed protein product, partial [marine sediment metagenome]
LEVTINRQLNYIAARKIGIRKLNQKISKIQDRLSTSFQTKLYI